jgi:hypothetical protein
MNIELKEIFFRGSRTMVYSVTSLMTERGTKVQGSTPVKRIEN